MSRYIDRQKAEEERRVIRRLLWRWGRVTAFCVRRHKDIEDCKTLISRAADVRPQSMTGLPHGSGAGDPTPRAAAMMAQLKERYSSRVEALAAEIEEELRFSDAIDEALRVCSEKEIAIIELKYKREYSTQRIASATNFSKSRVEQIERGAIDKLRKLIEIKAEGEKR